MRLAIGWTLVHSLWEGAIIAVALGAVLLATRSPRIRYAAACLAMLAILGGFAVTLVHVLPLGIEPNTIPSQPLDRSGSAGAVHAPIDLASPVLDAAVPYLAPVWITGVWLCLLWHVTGWISVNRLRRRGVCAPPPEWEEQFAGLRHRLRVSRPVVFLESSLAEVPVVVGHFRPVILMPMGLLTGIPSHQIEAILLHELAHVRRCDYLVNLWQRWAEGLLFYHPAVWWISSVIRTERENCCDDVAIETTGNAHGYASALAALEQNRWASREPAVAATGGNLVKRIRRLLNPKQPASAWTPLLAGFVFVATATVALAAWQSPPPQQTQTPYEKWVTEDVVYIIAKEERAAFEKLTTDPERQKFIEQFWQKRGEAAKLEHYRRLAYTNQRFGTSTAPGWKTDRGRIYIQYGPPDEMESHPSGDATTPPREAWRYHQIDGIGKNVDVMFVDKTRTGDYQMTFKDDR